MTTKRDNAYWLAEAEYICQQDPACHSVDEAFLYPGMIARQAHERAHRLYLSGDYTAARAISEQARRETGIEIHPGAQLGDQIFIDHGMGIVIGETAVVGNRVTMYHGVTLGGVHTRAEKRHPTIEDDVIIGTGATLLGDITIGQGSRIGAGAIVLEDVPPHHTAVGMPARLIPHK